MQEKTCCVTGHRNISNEQRIYIEKEMRREVREAIEDGFTHFISGFANGVDLIFADIVVEEKKQHPNILLEAAIPYAGRLNKLDTHFQELIQACDDVRVECEKYAPYSFDRRNRYMVDKSQRVIAVFDGRSKGGTVLTMRYARKLEREIHEIHIQPNESDE